MLNPNRENLKRKTRAALVQLGAVPELLEQYDLPVFSDATDLMVADVSASGREHLLIPEAAGKWIELKQAAKRDGVAVLIISAFRGFDKQLELIQEKVQRGHPIDEIITVMAPPGCSEHHTGRAVDVGTPGCEPLSAAFAETDSFCWLDKKAAQYGFKLSFPADNRWGFAYEPWHWYYGDPDV